MKIEPAILKRFEKVRALLASPNAGEAAAAKARWDEMVAKYGDPDKSMVSDAIDERWVKAAEKGWSYREVPEAEWPKSVDEQIREFMERTWDLRNASMGARRAARHFDDATADEITKAREAGRRCAHAINFLIDVMNFEVDGLAGGPWTVIMYDGAVEETFASQGRLIEFAERFGFEA